MLRKTFPQHQLRVAGPGVTESLAGRISVMACHTLYECKWSENPAMPIKSFESLRALVGPDGILSQSIITPERDRRQTAGGIWIEDSVELASLNPI